MDDFDAEELAAKLKRLRKIARLTTRDVEQRVGFSHSKVTKIENAGVLPSLEDVSRLARALGVSPAIGKALLEDARILNVRYGRIPDVDLREWPQRRWAEAERSASAIREIANGVIPGILQAPEYTHALLSMPGIRTYGSAASEVVRRMRRQADLLLSTVDYEVLISAGTLRPAFLSTELAIEQLEVLRTHIRRERVRIGLVPTEPIRRGEHGAILDSEVARLEGFAKNEQVELHDVADFYAAVAPDAIWQKEAYRFVEGEIALMKASARTRVGM